MNAQDDESLDGATPPPPKPTFDRAKVQRLLNTASRYGRIPGSDFIAEMAEQLRLSVAEIDGTAAKIDHEQANNLRAQRERDDALAECRVLRQDLLAARAKISAAPKPDDTPAPTPKKRGRKAKIVPMEEKKAVAQ
jgi:hypothetical protein